MFLRILKLTSLLLLIPVFGFATPQIISEQTSWRGQVRLTGPVQVQQQTVLKIVAGTIVTAPDPTYTINVRGRLLIEGTSEAPVRFEGAKNWQGISFVEAAEGSRIVQARFNACDQALSIIATSPLVQESSFSDCKAAIKLLRESHSEIRDNLFERNEIGLSIEMRSSPLVVGNEFSGHSKSAISASNSSRGRIIENLFTDNEQGVGILQKFPDQIRRNRFIGNRVGLYCYQTLDTPRIVENLFRDNGYGVVNFSFSYPVVRNNRFVANQTALKNDQFGSALVERNLFKKNQTAIYNNRKSNPKVRNNQFTGNKLGFFVDYSSYPEVKQNNFEKTGEGARLGIYQSADWEKRSGSKSLVMKRAQQRGSKNTMLRSAPEEFVDIIDLSNNWWGEKTSLLRAAGAAGNVDFFYDRHDKQRVVYEGFGPESYRLDEIRFLPVLESPIEGAGPQ